MNNSSKTFWRIGMCIAIVCGFSWFLYWSAMTGRIFAPPATMHPTLLYKVWVLDAVVLGTAAWAALGIWCAKKGGLDEP